MKYRVELTQRAERDLRRLFLRIDAGQSLQARGWFNGLEKTLLSLDENPFRGITIPEDATLRQLLFGRRRNVYRIIYDIDEQTFCVTILHIRHSAQSAFELENDD